MNLEIQLDHLITRGWGEEGGYSLEFLEEACRPVLLIQILTLFQTKTRHFFTHVFRLIINTFILARTAPSQTMIPDRNEKISTPASRLPLFSRHRMDLGYHNSLCLFLKSVISPRMNGIRENYNWPWAGFRFSWKDYAEAKTFKYWLAYTFNGHFLANDHNDVRVIKWFLGLPNLQCSTPLYIFYAFLTWHKSFNFEAFCCWGEVVVPREPPKKERNRKTAKYWSMAVRVERERIVF